MHLLFLITDQSLTLELKKCVFLGYPFGVKGYKVYDLSTKLVFISGDVIFHEDIFLFASENVAVADPFLSDLNFKVMLLLA